MSTVFGLSGAELARKLDVRPQLISEIETGRSKNPGSDFLLKLIDRIGLNPAYLAGDPDMFREVTADSNAGPLEPFLNTQVQISAIVPQEYSMVHFRKGVPMELETNESDPNGIVLLPLFNQRASAGAGQEVADADQVETLVPVVMEILGHRAPRDCGVVRVVGDSMAEIQLNNGDRAIFDRSDIEGDGVFVITHNGAVRIKRLQYRFDVKKVFIKSENKRYPDIEEEPLEAIGTVLRIEGKVIGWLHRHLY